MNCIGIDISDKELVVATSIGAKMQSVNSYKNTETGFAEIIQLLSMLKGDIKVCLETTGDNHFDLAIALSSIEGIEVMVITPEASSQFAKTLMKRRRTDALDAEKLALYCEISCIKDDSAPQVRVLH